MRPSCLDCARKHLMKAEINLTESKLGYPNHYWRGLGHISEAEDETVRDYPKLAEQFRNERKLLEEDPDYHIPLMDLVEMVTKVAEAEYADVEEEVDDQV